MWIFSIIFEENKIFVVDNVSVHISVIAKDRLLLKH